MRSTDKGRTWEKPVDIEPADGPEASYAVLLKTPYGRVYAFYNHNTDRVPEVKREDGGAYKRVDSLGHYVFKYTDDHGRTWSTRRYDIQMRAFDCDLQKHIQGRAQFFWNVGKPLIHGTDAILVIHKVGAMAQAFSPVRRRLSQEPQYSPERDPAKIVFETLPEGTVGLRTPPAAGPRRRGTEHVSLSDGSIYCVYAPSTAGRPVPTAATAHAPGPNPPTRATRRRRRVKHPRAANFV
jgi:hypothetical protein